MGLFGLGSVQTVVVLGAVVTMVISGSLSLGLLAVTAPPALIVVIVMVARWDGVSLAAGIAQRVRWQAGSRRGYTRYHSGPAVTGDHGWQLPGVLAATRLLAVDDPGGDFGVVHHQRLGTMAVTLRCAATSTWLADASTTDTWVASWGGWLANLGYLPMIDHVAVTVDTCPDQGSRLAEHVGRRIMPHSPASAQRVLRRLVEVSPAAAADVETRVTITFRPAASPARPRTIDEALQEIARTLPGLQDALGSCGLTVLGRATTAQLAATVRGAFDPAARADLARLSPLDLDRWVDWSSCGPVFAEEHIDRYVHDSGVSVSWAWHEAPRQSVHADVLARLMAPGAYPRRVTLLYRPLPAGEAARAVESEVNAAVFRAAYNRAKRRDETARDLADRERAQQTAREEAVGAGVGLLSLWVTTTVLDPDDLGRAVADVESRADIAKIRLRRQRAAQSTGFAATLPCGICPPQLARQWPR
ncbi:MULTISPECIES: SCO6880 family protein [unclassified Actinoplanes]|uniref:SCO6880 family protein n=1 Tax=unclassified Actinoplanes TaxID=2626549 RepID=UPI00031CAD6F|nr:MULTISPECIES: SCO6880 family protein [unclassified Actinoplanes]